MPIPSFPSDAEARHEEGFLNSADHLRLFWQRFTPPSPKATVAIVHGGGDHSGRYPALTTALVRGGFQPALLDFRGHGQSDGRRWYVDAFSDYFADLDAFVAKLRADGLARGKLFLVAHSMGGLVAALWGAGSARAADGFVLSSPYFRLAMRPPLAKVIGARLAGRIVPWLPVSTGIDVADLTSDPELQHWTDHDPLYGRATTPRWFDEARRAQVQALHRAGEFSAPLLVLAGGADRVADVDAARAFVAAASSRDKAIEVYEGFRHEIFNETARDRPLAAALAWLSAHAA